MSEARCQGTKPLLAPYESGTPTSPIVLFAMVCTAAWLSHEHNELPGSPAGARKPMSEVTCWQAAPRRPAQTARNQLRRVCTVAGPP